MVELISLHVPKTAGTSFRRILEQNYHDVVSFDYADSPLDPAKTFRNNYPAWKTTSDALVRNLNPSIRAVHGHFCLAKYAEHFPHAKKIMWIRDPARRLVSHYFFWKELPPTSHALHCWFLKEKPALLEFAAHPLMRNIVSNVFMQGYDRGDLDFIGIQEHFEADLSAMVARYGWKSVSTPRLNVTSDEQKDAVDEEALTKIRHLNAEDMSLYEHALAQNGHSKA